MAANPFRKAERRAVHLRAAIDGPTGAGKTLSALRIARGIVGPEGTIAVIDTERMTSEKFYADDAQAGGFIVAGLTHFQPTNYIEMIEMAEGNCDLLIIDSLSHAWSEGILPMVDAKGGKFDAWKDVTPHHNRLVNKLLDFEGHLIVTMRSKMAYEVSKDDRTGKTKIEKLGMQPVQRAGVEYEFDLIMDMDTSHRLVVSKSRIPTLADRIIVEPGKDFGADIAEEIGHGIPEAPSNEKIAAERRDALLASGPRELVIETMKAEGITSAELWDDDTYNKAVEAVKVALENQAPAEPEAKPSGPSEAEAKSESAEVGLINENDMRYLHAHARDLGLDHDDIKHIAGVLFEVDSTKKIPADRVQELVEAMRLEAESRKERQPAATTKES